MPFDSRVSSDVIVKSQDYYVSQCLASVKVQANKEGQDTRSLSTHSFRLPLLIIVSAIIPVCGNYVKTCGNNSEETISHISRQQ